MGSMPSCLLIIALYTVYTQQLGDENKDCHCLNLCCTGILQKLAEKGEIRHNGNCQTDKQ